MCLLDATYKMTKYALPMYFLAVKANYSFSVVGECIVENETMKAIQKGLETIKEWMKDAEVSWKRFFMTDFYDREIAAIEQSKQIDFKYF